MADPSLPTPIDSVEEVETSVWVLTREEAAVLAREARDLFEWTGMLLDDDLREARAEGFRGRELLRYERNAHRLHSMFVEAMLCHLIREEDIPGLMVTPSRVAYPNGIGDEMEEHIFTEAELAGS
jgi:hypothetical protein